MGRIRLVVAMILSFLCLAFVSCSDDEATTDSTSQPITSGTEEPPEIISVKGKAYKADISTINIAWDSDGDEPTQIQQDFFIATLKVKYAESVISFSDENSFVLTGTKDGFDDLVVESCDRQYNELFRKIDKLGNVDVVIEEDKVSFLADFFKGANGIKMYFSIDYVLIK